MGFDPTLSFYGLQGTQSLTIPVPPGMVPSELRAVVEMPPDIRAGSIAAIQDNRTISRVELPGPDQSPIAIPLAGTEVRDNAVTVQLRVYLVAPEGFCAADPSIPLRLNNTTISFAGTELPPTTVADFLPPILQKLTLFLPRMPSQAESDAVVRLTAAVVAHYGKQYTDVTVAALADSANTPPAPSQPLERQIVVREGPASGLTLRGAAGVPSLLISGPGNELANQSRLLSSNLSGLALSSKAVVGPLNNSAQLPPDWTTLRELGQPGVNATALANPIVTIGLDQTRVGRTAHNVRVHLRGSYTPLPSSLNGQVVVSVGADTVDRWAADPSGSIDRWVDVPDRVLLRYTNLGVAINAAGNTGRCGEFQPITLTIDGDSVVQTTAATPPVPRGFQSLPQALMPRVQVGIGPEKTDGAFADTVRAVAVLEGLQRLSALPIDTAVMPLQKAIDSVNPSVLISADSWDHPDITLPVASKGGGTLSVAAIDGDGAPATLTLAPGLLFGSLQTVFDGKRSLLIATSNGAPAQLDGLLTWLNTDPRHWSRLSGDAVIAPPGRDPLVVGAQPPRAEVAKGSDDSLVWWVGAGIVAFVAIGSGLIFLRSRQRT